MTTPSKGAPLSREVVSNLALDALFCILLYLWLHGGIEGAGNVYQVVFWVLMPMKLVTLLLTKAVDELATRPWGYLGWRWGMALAYVGALAWHGHTVMAGVMFFTTFVYIGSIGAEKKRSAA